MTSVNHEESVLHLLHTEEDILVKRHQKALQILAAGIAHEFNNILAGIGGYADIALGNLDDPTLTKRALNTSKRAVKQGMDIVRRMMHFTEHEHPHIHAGDVATLVRDMAYLFQDNFKAANIQVDFAFEPIPSALYDSSLLGIALTELFQNALDALLQVPSGKRYIHINASRTLDNVVITIHDSGEGIPPHIAEHAVHPFFTTRGPIATGSRQEAKGLGLSVCHGILKQMNGRLQIAAHANGGTAVSLCLPIADEKPSKAKREILIVDDEPTSRRILSAMLQQSGYHITEATNGADALQILAQSSIDLVYLDQHMPAMNGLDVLETIQQLGIRHTPPIIMITAHMAPALARQALEFGAVACITKPIRRSKIEYLTRLHMEQTALQCIPDNDDTQMRMFYDYVLLAESDTLMRDMLELLLLRSGYEVKAVSNEDAAIAATQEEYYHLILIDSGIATNRHYPAIRQIHLNNPYTPILMMTDDTTERLHVDAMFAGVTRLIQRPSCIHTLLNEIRYQIDIFRDKAPA